MSEATPNKPVEVDVAKLVERLEARPKVHADLVGGITYNSHDAQLDRDIAKLVRSLSSRLSEVEGENERLRRALDRYREGSIAAFEALCPTCRGDAELPDWAKERSALTAQREGGSSVAQIGGSPAQEPVKSDGLCKSEGGAWSAVRLFTQPTASGGGAHVIVSVERLDGAERELIREFADVSDTIIDHWARLP
ncbi:hypothetical protein [Phenylobacterium sp. J367]|uniref:hypothetical protein n=1 Tax=Phenylobacterium sp. J367 TaxID=2898435 RepID=UPI002150CE95|nr:hypothetical protein [Phenylobacterium sp. J367]MCR5876973.1 hypothetical protein [Phenylobacterium sp. J367]MCR5877041.1 hypothetical protein [Phenylobacterium sp. J367]